MTIEINPIALIQNELADRLSADDYFEDINVFAEREGDIESKIERSLKVITEKDSKIGVAVVVGTASADVNTPNLPGPHFDDTVIEIITYENPMFNDGASGTGKAGVDIARRVLNVLHLYRPEGLGQTLFADKEAIRYSGIAEPGVIAYSSKIRFRAAQSVYSKVGALAISPASGSVPVDVTITCADGDADIYYTLDKTYPWSGNANAVRYTAQFTIDTAAMLRAVAHKSGNVASDAAAVEYT